MGGHRSKDFDHFGTEREELVSCVASLVRGQWNAANSITYNARALPRCGRDGSPLLPTVSCGHAHMPLMERGRVQRENPRAQLRESA